MKWTRDIVELALLRRIAKALEESNRIAQYRCDREFPPIPVKQGKGERRGLVVTRQTERPTLATRKEVADLIGNLNQHR